MSGHSSSTTCPNCNNDCDTYSDHKPFDYVSVRCLECGFQTITNIVYMDLEELNEERENMELEPLSELPEQDENIW